MTNPGLRALLLMPAALLVGAPVVLVASPVHAATTYTWTAGIGDPHADGHSWGDSRNWSPAGVPGDGDSVIVPGIESRGAVHVDGVPAVALHDLTVAGTDDSSVYLGEDGEALTITGSFTWTGGRITAGLTLAPGSTGAVLPGSGKSLWAPMTVRGALTLSDTAVSIDWGNQLVVAQDATFTATGTARVTANRCCGEPSRVVNHGTIDVTSGSPVLEFVAVDQDGTLHVADGATLTASGGLVRLRPGAAYTGSGTLEIEHTSDPAPDPDHPSRDQYAALLDGASELRDGFTLVAGPEASLTGTGSVTGTGTLELAGGDVYADLSVGPGVHTVVDGSTTSTLGVWDPDITGYHAAVQVAGAVDIAPGSTLAPDEGTVLTLRSGARLDVPGGAQIAAPRCCASDPGIVAARGSTLELGGGAGAATLRWLIVSTSGATNVRRGAQVTVDDGRWVQHGGRTTLGASSVLTLRGIPFELARGTLRGAGRIAGSVTNTHGSVAPGTDRHPSRLRFAAYHQGASGTLAINTTGRRSDRLVVDGTARLGGRLVATGTARGRVTVLSAQHRVRKFARCRLGPWRAVRYSPTSVTLVP
jgi:fibronectin-binding autotransporter adhesin